jgi:hypothetical protein
MSKLKLLSSTMADMLEDQPMPYLLIHHKVENFDTWKSAYDAHRAARDKAGLTEQHLLRNAADPNDIVILFQADDLERTRAFARSNDLRTAMQKAGVVGTPELIELE